jgi:hypothetical protein
VAVFASFFAYYILVKVHGPIRMTPAMKADLVPTAPNDPHIERVEPPCRRQEGEDRATGQHSAFWRPNLAAFDIVRSHLALGRKHAMSHDEPKAREPKFQISTGVKYKGELWNVSEYAGGALLGYKYTLTGIGGKKVTASEEELEPWTD